MGAVGNGRPVLRFLFRVVVVAAGFLVLTVGLVWAFGNNPGSTFVGDLSEIRPNRPLYVEDIGLYVVHRGDQVVALDESLELTHEKLGSIGLTDTVRYCPKSELFEAGEYGSKFDWRGRYYGGPAPTGLTTYPVEVKGRFVYVDLESPIEGRPRDRTAYEPVGPFCTPV